MFSPDISTVDVFVMNVSRMVVTLYFERTGKMVPLKNFS